MSKANECEWYNGEPTCADCAYYSPDFFDSGHYDGSGDCDKPGSGLQHIYDDRHKPCSFFLKSRTQFWRL